MARRALVLGSQIEGLRGVETDCRRMAVMLDERGFAIDLRVGADATRDGMLDGYDRLIAESSDGDAAVVYYCGHGYHAHVPEEKRAWQCIAPTDLRQGSATDWRGITAWELSTKQAQLTERTRNVTVILDCCHSAQISRSDGVPGAVTRALSHPVQGGFDRHLAALRALHGPAVDRVDPVGNPHAVRVVACGQSESAFEYPDEEGRYHGVFTDVLIDVLTEVGDALVSWAAIIATIRARVQRRFVRQRPALEGPARRGLFSLTEHGDPCRVAVHSASGQFRLDVGRLTGAAVGDVYGMVPADGPAHDTAHPLAELEIVEVFATSALARRTAGAPEPEVGMVRHSAADGAHRLGAETRYKGIAVPLRRCAVQWPVAIDAPPAPRAVIEDAITASATLRVARPDEPGALATLRVTGDAATIDDSRGPLFAPVPFPSELHNALAHLASLGIAQGIRELEGEHGVLASELAIELGIVRDRAVTCLPDHGSVFGLGDRYCVRIDHRSERPLFVHVLNLSARGKVTLLTHFARNGIVLSHRLPSVMLGQRADGALLGVGLRWPDGLPRDGGPRLTELVVIATLRTTDLSGLETHQLVARSSANQLERALAQLCGARYRDAVGAGPLDGFLVKRLSLLLAPGEISKRSPGTCGT